MLTSTDHSTYFELKYRATRDPWQVRSVDESDIYREMINLLARRQPHYGRTLDIGCGEGLFTEKLMALSDHVTGIDISETAVRRAAARPGLLERADFRVFDVVADDWDTLRGEGAFDLVNCSQVLYYYRPEQVAGVLARIARVLAANGSLLITNTSEGNRYELADMLRLVAQDFHVLESCQIERHYCILAGPRSSGTGGSTSCQRSAALAYYERTLPSLSTIDNGLTSYNRRKVEFATRRILDLLATRPRVRVLDYGCGTGELFTLPLVNGFRDDPRVEFTGFDVDEASVLRLSAHAARNGLARLHVTSEIAALAPSGYDLVCCLEVLEHLVDPRPVVESISALTAVEGLLYVTVPNGFGPGELESAAKRRIRPLVNRSDCLLSLGLRLKRWLLGRTAGGPNRELPVVETLHDANNVHVQRYRRSDVRRLFAGAPLDLVERGNTAFLIGLAGRMASKIAPLRWFNDWAPRVLPAPLASGWYFVYRKPGGIA